MEVLNLRGGNLSQRRCISNHDIVYFILQFICYVQLNLKDAVSHLFTYAV